MTDQNPGETELDALLGVHPGTAWRRWLLLLGLVVGVLALIVLGTRFVSGGPAANYRSARVERSTLDIILQGKGRLEPVEEQTIGASIEGVIDDVFVRVGDRVSAGQILATIDGSALISTREQFRRLVNERRATLADAEMALSNARKRLALFETVHNRSGNLAPSDREMDLARNAAARAEEAMTTAGIELRAAVDQRDLVDRQLEQTQIRAPIAGVVRRINVAPDQPVKPSSTSKPLFVLASPYARLGLRVSVAASPDTMVHPGMKVSIVADTLPDETLAGQVERVDTAPSPASTSSETSSSGTAQVLSLQLSVANPHDLLRPDMVATASIDLGPRRDVLTVPDAALMFAAGADADAERTRNQIVYVLGNDGTPRRISVTVGGGDGKRHVVSSPRLQAGMRVIVGLQ